MTTPTLESLPIVWAETDEDPEEPCLFHKSEPSCSKVAVWGMYTNATCGHLPDPVPFCDPHKMLSESTYKLPGAFASCGHCGTPLDILKFDRLPR